MTDTVAERLRTAFVAAYQRYVERLFAERGLPAVVDAVAEGERWLEEALTELLARPTREQTRSPLELFQEAMRFPTEALQAAGASPVPRDPVAESALPGDVFDLAPASSQVLGEDAWQAHLAWGAAKAQRMGPMVVLVTRNLMDLSRIEQAGTGTGFRVVTARTIGHVPEGGSVMAFVDLEHPEADDAIRVLAESSGRVIAYGPHVDDVAMLRAKALGADDAVPRSRFFKDVRAQFPAIA